MRPIDADSLNRKKKYRFQTKGGCFPKAEWFLKLDDVFQAPTIDAVPVVRCRECKHYKEFRTKRNRQIMRLCYRMGKHDMEYPVKPDDFCSRGERKTDG